MKTIYKYPLPKRTYFTLSLPQGAEILTVQMQGDEPYLWAVVETDAPLQYRYFRMVGTGHPFSDEHARYISTFQTGPFVFHIFELDQSNGQ